MEIFFPAQTLSLFQVFAPCFTAPSFIYFRAYVWALMVVEGRKCLTHLARCAFFHQRALSSWERFLAEHRWSLTALTERLVTLVVTKLGDQLQVHKAYLVGTDTTLVAKTAKRMLGVQKWKDHSDNADRGGYLVGHHWNLVGLLSPWESRWLCWPLVMRLVPGLKGARQWIVGDLMSGHIF
jgi:DDE superfamily endonuclease